MILAPQVSEAVQRLEPLARYLARRWDADVPLERRMHAVARGLVAAAEVVDPADPGFTEVAVRAMVRELRLEPVAEAHPTPERKAVPLCSSPS